MLRGLPNRELVDESLQEEIAVLADLMLAVAHATGPLSQDEIDDALGILPEQDEDDDPS